ncbi:deleted in malignant brain tumors 1 protein [Strongylocentrotus purpuratus]|uniref:SRCR domain-containing protein n=1 Tax=Strongylocentrotus purpuratus TaxID=7668 RepID=A0A7M7HK02_STRPU|nr:deleted in malignant brain tumors 1 protein [Strongylocentrotus purpuratus]
MDIFSTMKPLLFISLVGLFSIFPYITGNAEYVRLVDGQVPSEGRVEVFYYERWGSVCDDHWSLDEAEVVCKDLGYSGADLALVAAAYGLGSGPIWLDDVECRGGEESLNQCNHNTIGTHDCAHEDDASVMCTARGSLRLTNGTSSHDGILQIMGNSSSSWGSVCGDTWTAAAGEVACRQLGFSGYLNSSFSDPSNSTNSGHDDDPWTFFHGFRCYGSERRLEVCPDAEWDTVDACHEKRNVILQCDSTDVRLVDGSVPYEGRVEVFYGATWGTVCDDQWGIQDASVACRQLGYELGAKEAPRNSYFGSADGPILLDDLYCYGQESSLFSCPHSGFANDNCNHRTDAGAVCLRKDKQIRLLGGFTSYEGVVQVWYYDSWHTVCDDTDHWGREEREVVCRQLGYEVDDDFRTPVAVINAVIGDTLVRHYRCTGEEEVLYYDCPWDYTSVNECLPETVAQAWCSKPKDLDIRLQNSEYAGQGRLELYHSGIWGTVRTLNEHQSEVICRQLGYESVMEIYDEAVFGTGDGPIWDLETITCDGNEDNLRECTSDWDGRLVGDQDHTRDISMMCRPYESIGTLKPRLVGYGNAISNGRLEVYLGDGAWGTVCSSEGWGQTEAEVVCRQLNYASGQYAKIMDPSEFPNSYGPTAFSNVDCDADDDSLRECQYGAWGERDCLHDQDVGIECYYYGEPETGGGIPVWEVILIAAMGASMFIILIGLAIYQRGRHRRRVSTPTHTESRDDNGYIHNPAFDMTEPPPDYRPSTPPPTESPPSYESLVLESPYKLNEDAATPPATPPATPRVDEDNRRGHDLNDQRTTHQNNAMPRGDYQTTTYI